MESHKPAQYSSLEAALGNLRSAIGIFTGGVFRPDTSDPQWKRLATHIMESKYTAAEFCYYAVNYLKGTNDPRILMFKAFITSDKVWKQFEEYKATRAEDIRVLVGLQHEVFENECKVFGSPLETLTNDHVGLNAAVRVDLALSLQENENVDPSSVIEKYGSGALYMCLGCPEYRAVCWFLDKWLMLQEHKELLK
jgi:hypothetical protein